MKRHCCHSNRWNTLAINTIWYPESYSMHSISFILFRNILFEVEICLSLTFQETVGSHLNLTFWYTFLFRCHACSNQKQFHVFGVRKEKVIFNHRIHYFIMQFDLLYKRDDLRFGVIHKVMDACTHKTRVALC